jgi:putative transposase
MSAIPKREQQEVAADLAGVWKQEKQEAALLNLAAITSQISEALSRSGAQLDGR